MIMLNQDKQDNISTKKCPFMMQKSHNQSISILVKAYAKLNNIGLKLLGKAWLPQYFGAIYPGLLIHQPSRGILGIINGQKKDFQDYTVVQGFQASEYFAKSGIAQLARDHKGICTFWMGMAPAIYLVKNIPVTDDINLSPPLAAFTPFIGNFLGALPLESEQRKKKRAAFVKTFTNMDKLKANVTYIKKYALEFFNSKLDQEYILEDFTMELIAYINSHIPGIFDFSQKPLTEYISTKEYGPIMREFIELLSRVISKLDQDAQELFKSIAPLIRNLLIENFEAINNAAETNIIKQQFAIAEIEFSKDSIQTVDEIFLKELGLAIIAMYDTTSLSLYWTLCYIESLPEIKTNILSATQEIDLNNISYFDLVVLESLRLAGSNSTAQHKVVIKPFIMSYEGIDVYVRKGTMIWLDRHHANQDSDIFPNPKNFDPNNIKVLFKSADDNIFNLLSHNRYEINSFTMVNTEKNPRKCPGRFHAVTVQATVLRELYSNFHVEIKEISTDMRLYNTMPKPAKRGLIKILAK